MKVTPITPLTLKEKLTSSSRPLLLDVREQDEWDICHIEGASLVPLGTVPDQISQILPHDQPVVVYCHHGVRSLHAAEWMVANGFEKVMNLEGGIDAWAAEVEPAMARY
ncbi:MAG: rhodanese-like domain-containing protein [Verrucomicrobiota bacterium]